MALSLFDFNAAIVFSGLALYIAIHKLYLRPLVFSPLKNVPGPSYGHFFFGQSKNIVLSEVCTLHMKWAEEHGPVVRIIGPVGMERMMFLSPNALQRILVSEWMTYPRPDFLRNILGIAAGYGLLTVTGDEHKMMRRAMNPAFSLSNLIAQVDMYYPPLEGLVKILHGKTTAESDPLAGTEVLIYDWMSKVTLDIICATAFGYHPDSVHNGDNELAIAYHELLSLQSGPNIARLALMMNIPGFPRFLRTHFAYQYRKWIFRGWVLSPTQTLLNSMHIITNVSRQMLQKKLREADVKDSGSKKDIMSLLVRARMNNSEDGYKMTDDDLVEQVLTFLGAGHETTASGISWTLWLLATHPDIQAQLRDEVLPVVETTPRPDYRTLKDLVTLDGVVMESLRVMPPVPVTVRKVARDDWVDGYHLPKGTLLAIAIRAVNTYSGIWGPDAHEFQPSRWQNLPSSFNSAFSFLSFVAGPHSCIGRTMAILEMKAVVAVLIAHFEFLPAYEGQKAKPTAAITMKPEDNLPLRIKPVGKIPLPV